MQRKRPNNPNQPSLKREAGRYQASRMSWLKSVLATCARTRSLAVSATPHSEIVLTNAATTFHGYSSLRELSTACLSAVQGEARKEIDNGPLSATFCSGNTAAAAAQGVTVFGWRLRITASINNFAYRPITVTIGATTGAAGVGSNNATIAAADTVAEFQIFARRLPVDVFFLSVSNAGGLATVTPGGFDSNLAATKSFPSRNGIIVSSLADGTTFAAIESLTARDLLARGQGIPTHDGLYDYTQEGIRDEEDYNDPRYDIFG